MAALSKAQWTKDQWRTDIIAVRRGLEAQTRREESAGLAEHAAELAAGVPTTCAYVPVASEPGSTGLLSALHAAGTRVLLPVTGERGQPLNWAEFTDVEDLHRAGYGLREPAGRRLGPVAIAGAGLVLVPALAVDRHGNRLGRGAGFYDRSLVLADSGAHLVAVVRSEEVLPQLPHEPHDRAVTAALTPAGLIRLGNAL